MATETNNNYITQIELVQEGTNTTIDIGIPHSIPVTYGELYTLIETSKLTPGVWYRITDYECTVNGQDGIGVKNNQTKFDIVLLALSNNELSEEGFVAKNDTQNIDVSGWKVWYSYDNSCGCSWYGGRKGVIYRLIDGNGNDCPYDFKNITIGEQFTFNNNKQDSSDSAKNNVIKPYKDGEYYKINNIILNGINIESNKFGEDCHDITLGLNSGTNKTISENVFEDGVNNVNIEVSTIKRVHVHKGVQGLTINVGETQKLGDNYEKNISIDSDSTDSDKKFVMWYI